MIALFAHWRDVPQSYGPWSTIASRFYRWRKAGIWQQILEQLQQQADRAGELDWQVHHVDGSVIRAHQHAAGAGSVVNRKQKRWGALKAVSVPRFICFVEGNGKPITPDG